MRKLLLSTQTHTDTFYGLQPPLFSKDKSVIYADMNCPD